MHSGKGEHFSINDMTVSKYVFPSLSTVKVYTEVMGETAVDTLLERMNGRTIRKKILSQRNWSYERVRRFDWFLVRCSKASKLALYDLMLRIFQLLRTDS